MKSIVPLILSVALGTVVSAQQPLSSVNPFPKTITVSGSAEMEIIPDEIYVAITLSEYQKRGEEKKSLEVIRDHFLKSCKEAGIPDSNISIKYYTGSNYFLRKKKKDNGMMASITYQVKFANSKIIDALVEKLDDDATQNFMITHTSHSKITEIRKQLKVKAIQAAKDKGIYLTQAIDEKLGSAITIQEPEMPVITPASPYDNFRLRGIQTLGANAVSRDEGFAAPISDTQIDFRKLNLRFEVTVVFALQ